MKLRQHRGVLQFPGLVFAVGMLCLWLSHHAFASSFVWIGGAPGRNGAKWSDAGNWTGGIPNSNASNDLIFANAGAGASDNDTAGPLTINSVIFSNNAGAFTLSGNALNLSGFHSALIQNSATAQIIASALAFTSNTVFGGSGPGTLTIQGALSGAGTFTLTNSHAVLVLQGTDINNANSGDVSVNAGELDLDMISSGVKNSFIGNAFGGNLNVGATSGSFTGTVRYLNSGQISNTSAIVINGLGVMDMNGFGDTVGSIANRGVIMIGGGSLGTSGAFTNLTGGVISEFGTISSSFVNLGTINVTNGTMTLSNSPVQLGTINIASNATLNSVQAWSNNSTINLLGGTLQGGVLTNFGLVDGFGTVSAAITNFGSIVASNGILLILNATVSGTGQVLAVSGGTVQMSNSTVGATLVNNGGTLTVKHGKSTVNGQAVNHGKIVFINSVATFNAGVYNDGIWVIDPSTNTIAGNLDNAGLIVLTNSVNIIGSNFINEAVGVYSSFQTSVTYVAGVFTNMGEVDIVQGSSQTNGNAFLSGISTVLVSDAGSLWSNATLNVGVAGNGGAAVIVSNGANLTAGAIAVGSAVNSSNNVLNIGGQGSRSFATSGVLTVGASGGGYNVMTVTNANLDTTGAVTLGNGSSNNTINVYSNGIWNLHSQSLTVGLGGATGNLLNVIGGTVTGATAFIVGTTGSGNNTVFATNAILASTSMTVGNSTSNNTVTANNSQWRVGGAITVGSTLGTGNVLTVNGGAMTNATTLTVGTGAGSYGNTMVISGGANVNDQTSYIGNGSSNNTMLVTDPGTTWMNIAPGGSGLGVIHVGAGVGVNNSLIISNGAYVFAGETLQRPSTAIGDAAGASNNNITVTGSGSVLSNLFDLYVGKLANSNTLNIANGGLVAAEIVYVGSANQRLTNNTVVVTDTGSVLRALSSLQIGSNLNSFGNSVLVSNGASLVVGINGNGSYPGTIVVGGGAGAISNSLTIVGSTSSNGLITVGASGGGNNFMIVSNATITYLQSATSKGLTIGSGSSNNVVTVQDAATVWNFGGGAITIGSVNGLGAGGATGNLFNVVSTMSLTNIGGMSLYDQNQTWVFSNRNFTSGGGINLGSPGMGGNTLTLTNQNYTAAAGSTIGTSSSNNTLSLLNSTWSNAAQSIIVGTGTAVGNGLSADGSVISNAVSVTIGTGTSNFRNFLSISNGSKLFVGASGITIGTAGSSNNSFIINGGSQVSSSSTVVTNAGSLTIGGSTASSYNTMTISNATLFTGNSVVIGNSANASSNSVFVLANALWNLNAQTLQVGISAGGTSNLLNVNGGTITNVNTGVFVDGFNNRLVINNGGKIFSVRGDLTTFGSNDTALITDPGSMWTISTGNLMFGQGNGKLGSLVISNGGAMNIASSIEMDGGFAGGQHSVLVTGSGSVITNTVGAIFVGDGTGSSNQFTVANGGLVVVTSGSSLAIGAGSASSTNTLIVTDAGSVFSNASASTVGSGGGYNNLIVSNGASFYSGNVTLGSATSSNNSYSLIGLGGQVTVSNGLITIGASTSGFNTMTVSNANVRSVGLTVGGNGASNNTVTIQDGSTWNFGGGAISVGSVNGVGASGATGDSFNVANAANLTNIGGLNLYSRNNTLYLSNRNLAASITDINLGSPGLGNNSVTLSNQTTITSSAASTIGLGSSNNFLNLIGGVVWNGGAQGLTIGSGTAFNNAVTNNGSVLTNMGVIGIGLATGSLSNSLTIFNGGQLLAGNINVGSNSAGSAGGFWNMGGTGAVSTGTVGAVTIGGFGSGGNAMILTNAILTSTGALNIGYYSSNNTVSVLANSTWNLSGQSIGLGSQINGLAGTSISNFFLINGGLVSNGVGLTLGNYPTGGGQPNSANSVLITNGGRFFISGGIAIGSGGNPSSSNTLVITGAGSILSNGNQIAVGASPGGFNILTIANGGALVNYSGGLMINSGGGVSSSNDMVLVTGSGSVFSNLSSSAITVGGSGAGGVSSYNSLIVSNSASLYTVGGLVLGAGTRATNTVGNVIAVDGAGSVITDIGSISTGDGSSNFLIVANGGLLVSSNIFIGGIVQFGQVTGSNVLSVTSGGTLINNGVISIGNGSFVNDFNTFTVNGGTVSNGTITVGLNSGANTMTATNATLSTFALVIGNGGSSNTVNILDNTSWLFTGGGIKFGNGISNVLNIAQNNTVLTNVGGIVLGGAGSTFTATNASGRRIVILGTGGSISVGDTAGQGNNTLILSNQSFTTTAPSFIGNNSSNNTLTVLADTSWDNGNNNITVGVGAATGNVFTINNGQVTNVNVLTVGSNTTGVATLNLTNNGVLSVKSFIITNNSISATNSVFNFSSGTLTTSNAANQIAANLVIASNSTFAIGGSWNMLGGSNLISSVSSSGGVIGTVQIRAGAQVTVTSNAVWNTGLNTLTVNGSLVMSNGGKSFQTNVNQSGQVLLSGTGTTWNTFSMALASAGSSTIISNGAALYINGNGNALQNGVSAGNRNSITVTGPGSVLTNGTVTAIGYSLAGANSNSLTVANGGMVVNGARGVIGLEGMSNWVLVTGQGSTWSNLALGGAGVAVLEVGESGSLSTLTISNGGLVYSVNTFIGVNAGSSNSSILVTGSGSVLTNTGNLAVGGNNGAGSSFETMTVAGGGTVYDASGIVGSGTSGAISNVANVTGAGSSWRNSSTLYIGGNLATHVNASNNVLNINNGGAVISAAGVIGNTTGDNSNAVVVSGAGSVWTNTGLLVVGATNASANSLALNSGGGLQGGSVVIGYSAGAISNSFNVTGGIFSNGAITVGTNGSSYSMMNLLNATGYSAGLSIGAGSSNNFVGVTNSTWNLGNGALIFGNGLGNVLAVDSASVLSNIGGITMNDSGRSLFITNATGLRNMILAASQGTGFQIGNSNGFGGDLLMISNQSYQANTPSTIGNNSSNNTMTVLGGVVWRNVALSGITVGNGAATGNVLIVDGGGVTGGTSLSNITGLVVGIAGASGNTFTLTNGAILAMSQGVFSRSQDSSGNNWNISGGPGGIVSTWNGNSNTFILGQAINQTAASNVLVVSAGGVVSNIGGTAGQINYTIIGSGQNGAASYSNRAVIQDGGQFLAISNILVGYILQSGSTASSNSILVNNGIVSTPSQIYVGLNTNSGIANFNSLIVTNGGSVTSFGGAIGLGGTNNFVSILGVNSLGLASTWNLGGGSLYVGSNGVGNSLTVNGLGTAGGALLTNAGALVIGGASASFSNSLTITNGGQFYGGNVTVGGAVNASNNSYNIIGAALADIVSNGLITIGSTGAGFNSMTTTNAQIRSQSLFVGSGSSNNTVSVGDNTSWNLQGGSLTNGSLGGTGNVITASSSVLTNVGAITIGTNANYNTLTLANNAQLWSLGSNTVGKMANSNTLNVASGSMWDMGGATLTVGSGAATGNVLNITDSVLTNGALIIGTSTASTNNQVTIGGASLVTLSSLSVAQSNFITFTSGQLNSSSTAITNGLALGVGVASGISTAIFNAVGGTHSFNNGLTVFSNSWLTGTGTLNGGGIAAITLTNGGIISAGLGTNGIGTLSLNNFNWVGGGIYQFQLSNFNAGAGNGWDLLNISGTLTNVNGAAAKYVIRMDSLGYNASQANFISTNDYAIKIANFGTGIGFNAGQFTIDQSAWQIGGSWNVITNNGGIYLTFSGITINPNFAWTDGSNGVWTSARNWTNNAAPGAGGSSSMVLQFGNNGAAAFNATNNLGGTYQLNQLALNSASSATNFIFGNTIQFAGLNPYLLQVNQGIVKISNSIDLATGLTARGSGLGTVILASNITGSGQFIKQGGYNLILQGSNTFVGPVLVDSASGTLTLANPYGAGTNSITVSNGTLIATQAGASYTVGNGWNNQSVLVNGAGSTWSNVAGLVVGSGVASGNVVTVANDGTLSATTITIGNSANSVSNGVALNSGGTLLSGSLIVGNVAGASNNFYNVGGAGDASTASNGTLMVGNTSANFNSVTVTNGTLMTGGMISVGNGSSSNTLTILDDGVLNALGQVINVGSNAAWGNSVVVNGGMITNVGVIGIGVSSASSYSSFTVSNGGVVVGSGGIIVGVVSGGISNSLNVGGLGLSSVLSNNGQLSLGNNGPGVAANFNSVTVTNASLYTFGVLMGNHGNDESIYILSNSVYNLMGGTNFVGLNTPYRNSFIVDGGTLTNASYVEISRNILTGTASASGTNTIAIRNGGRFYSGTVDIGGGFELSGATSSTISRSNQYLVGGVGASSLVSNGAITVYGYDNNMVVTNATLLSGTFSLGNFGRTNTASVLSGGTWNLLNSTITVGNGAGNADHVFGNVLTVNGGTVTNFQSATIGLANNLLNTITNGIVISNGGQFFGGSVTVGNHSGGTAASAAYNNYYLVGGNGLASTVSNGAIVVGNSSGSANFMNVTNATLISGAVTVGLNGSSNSAQVFANSSWNMLGNSLTVGSGASTNNTFSIFTGGLVTNTSVVLGGVGSIFNLNGGKAAISNINLSVNSAQLNLNGGTLQAMTSTNTFISGVGTASVLAGGVTIDTLGFGVGITQSLLHAGAGIDGGLTKLGTGTLTLGASNTYNGVTTIGAGQVVVGNSNALFSSTVSNLVNGGLLFSNNLTTANIGGLAGSGSFALSNQSGVGVILTVGNNGSTNTYSGSLNGTGSLVNVGGQLTLSGTNALAGSTLINAGQIILANGLALTNSTVAVNTTSGLVFSNTTTYTLGGIAGTSNVGLTNSAGAAITLGVGQNSATMSSVLSGSGNLIVSGVGTQRLTAANTYSGGTTITNGSLIVDNASGSGVGSGAVTVNNGGFFGGTGTVSGAVTVNSGGIISAGDGGIAPFTVGSLTLSSGSFLNYDFGTGPSTNDTIIVSTVNGLTLNGGTFNLFQNGTSTGFDQPGIYKLIGYSGTLNGTGLGALAVNNATANRLYTFSSGGGYINLSISGLFGWSAGGATNLPPNFLWSNAPNWGTNLVPQAFQTLQFFGNTGLQNTNDIAANTPFSGFQFMGGAGAFTLTGNVVNLTGNIINYDTNVQQTINMDVVLQGSSWEFNASNGNLLVNGNISETNASLGIVKTGANTLTLSGTNSYSGGTILQAGTLAFARSSGMSGSITNGPIGSGSLTINAGTITAVNGSQTISNSILVAADFTVGGAQNLTLAGLMDLSNSVQAINIANTANTFFAGSISNGGWIKLGSGTLTLVGNGTYVGGTILSNGTIVVSNLTGSATGLGNVLVGNNTTLSMQGGIINGNPGSVLTNLGYLAGYGTVSNLVVNNSTILAIATNLPGAGTLTVNLASYSNSSVSTIGVVGSNSVLNIVTPGGINTLINLGTISLSGGSITFNYGQPGIITNLNVIAGIGDLSTFPVVNAGTTASIIAQNPIDGLSNLTATITATNSGLLGANNLATLDLTAGLGGTAALVNQGTIAINGGTFTINAGLGGLSNITGGVIMGYGVQTNFTIANVDGTVIATNGILTIGLLGNLNQGTLANGSATANLAFTNAVLVNQGNINLMGGGLLAGAGVSITNQATITGSGQYGSSLYNDAAGLMVVTNGTLSLGTNGNEFVTNAGQIQIKNGGTLNVVPDWNNNSGGLVSFQGGSLVGGSITNNGQIIGVGSIGSVSVVNQSGGTIMAANPVNGLSIFSVNWNDLDDGTMGASNSAVLNVVISGGAGSSFHNVGTISMLGGSLIISNAAPGLITNDLFVSGSGTITPVLVNVSTGTILASNGLLNVSLLSNTNSGTIQNFDSSSSVRFTNTVLVNMGTIAINSGGFLMGGGARLTNENWITGPGVIGGRLYNDSTGTIVATNGTLTIGTNSTATFVNLGAFNVAAASTGNVANAWVNSNGTINLLGGVLTGGTLTNKGHIVVSNVSTINNGLLNVGGGLVSLSSGSTLSVAPAWLNTNGTVDIGGGTLAGGALTNEGFVLGNGAINSISFVNAAGGVVSNLTGNTLNVQSDWVNINGTLAMAGGYVGGGNVTNLGIITGFGAINSLVVNNSGGILSAASGTLTLSNAPLQSGTFIVNNSATLNATADWSNNGVVDMLGGTLANANITNNGLIAGSGLVHPKVVNLSGGSISASNGTLVLDGTQAFSQAGTLQILAGSTLILSNGVSGLKSFVNGGTIALLGGVLQADTVTNSSYLKGFGTAAAGLYNTGTVLANSSSSELHITGSTVYNDVGGSMLASTGRIAIDSIFTNAGTVSFQNSYGTFNSVVVNKGVWVTDPSTLTFNSDFSVATNGFVTKSGGDVYSFKSNFFNASLLSNQYNTLDGKFVFNGTGGLTHTQVYGVAGINLGGYNSQLQHSNEIFFTTAQGTFSTNSFLFYGANDFAGYSNNFALGDLEVGSLTTTSTLELVDSFGLFETNDGKVAALYLNSLTINPGSLLIISNNVELFFRTTNGVTGVGLGVLGAGDNILLLNGSSFHQIDVVPEPSVLLLLVIGGAGIARYRRIQKRKARLKA